VAALRQLRDDNDAVGFDKKLWSEMSEMGWTALTIPEQYGGLAFGYVGLGQVLEESGRTLTASPLVSTSLLCSSAILLGGNDAIKQELLSEIMAGDKIYAFAHEESKHHNPELVNAKAVKTTEGYEITGKKTFVLDGHVADKLIVSARSEQGIELFVVDAKAKGISIEKTVMMDSRNSSEISFDATPVIFKLSGAERTLEKTLDIARIGLSAEMLGCSLEAFERTVNYMKARKQFGVSIGVFQALQHRASKMFCEIELLKSVVLKALQGIDENVDNLPELASMAKAKAGETVKLITQEGVQIFGGIGMTDDEEIGFFIKRARVAQITLGDYNFHLDRFARLNNY
jgi:alkylation response protein AidB-like acyl-CoA dehydrogenase